MAATTGDLETMVRSETKGLKRVVVIPDIHAPYEDYRALHGVYKFIQDYKPHKVVLLGDVVDFYALSRFDKAPDRITGLQQEIDAAKYHFTELRKIYKGPVTMLEGNHEFRLIKYLRSNPEMSSLKKVNTVESLLDLKDFDIQYKKMETINGVLFKHGHLVRGNSGYTAKGELDAEGTSGVSGHTHRMGAHYHTDRSGQHAWFEMGHLCEESAAEYMEGRVPNWQKGFGLFEYNPENRVWRVQQVPVVNNSFIVGGKTYSWNGKEHYKAREKLR